MLAGSQAKGKRDMRFAGSSGSTFSRRPTNSHRANSSTIALFSDGMARKAVQALEDRETRVPDAAPPLPVQQLQLGDAQQESRVVNAFGVALPRHLLVLAQDVGRRSAFK
jgi:hypothetical protein